MKHAHLSPNIANIVTRVRVRHNLLKAKALWTSLWHYRHCLAFMVLIKISRMTVNEFVD